MSTAIRLDDQLIQAAEIEAANHKRTPPKQIEYWAEIGKAVSRCAPSNDLLALMQGIAQVSILPPQSVSVASDSVFEQLEKDRQQGTLSQKVTRANYRYEASLTHPGLLDRVELNGTRQTGHFRDGEFVPVK